MAIMSDEAFERLLKKKKILTVKHDEYHVHCFFLLLICPPTTVITSEGF